MIASVVFDCQALNAIEQVWPAQETAALVGREDGAAH
jgi:hypothetical protein